MQTKNAIILTAVQTTRGRWQWRLLGLALGVIAALLILPRTGWLVRQQVQYALPALAVHQTLFDGMQDVSLAEAAGVNRRLLRVQKEHPQDVGIQTASALQAARMERQRLAQHHEQPTMNRNTVTASGLADTMPDAAYSYYLQPVMQRFPASPLAYALFLRYELQGRIVLQRPEMYWSREQDPPAVSKLDPEQNTPEALAEYEVAARHGEQIDPGNAYFPMMLAIVHFASSRDADACADIDRAAADPRWEDYSAEEIRQLWRLPDLQPGYESYLAQLPVAEEILYPHLEVLKNVARMVKWQAMLQEKQGNIPGGIGLRSRLMRVALTMQDQSHSRIGSLIAIDMFRIAAGSPNAVTFKAHSQDTAEVVQYQFDNYYRMFLARHGYAAEGEWYFTQSRAFYAERHVVGGNEFGLTKPLFFAWALGLVLLSDIILLGGLGGVAAWFHYHARFRPSTLQPVPQTVVQGFWIGFALLACLGWLTLGILGDIAMLGMVLVMVLMGLALVCYTWRVSRPVLLTTLLTILGLYATVTFLLWQTRALDGLVGSLLSLCGVPNADHTGYFWETWLPVLAMLTLPAVLFYLLAVTSRVRHQPIVAGSIQGFRRVIVPLISVLLLGYAGIAWWTADREETAKTLLSQRIENEAAYARQHPDGQ